MTGPLNTIYANFGIGYGIEFGCLYILQGHYFIGTLLLWSTDEYVKFRF